MVSKFPLNPIGIKSLRDLLQNELPNLRQSPILLISSEPAATSASHAPIHEASRLVQFTISQQLGLRTVPATITSAFPSLHDLESRRDLLRRTGAASIVAVGSGAAMDLAKALARDNKHEIEQVILVPSTYAAMVASGSSHSLLLDPTEETLVPSPGEQNRDMCPITVAPLELKYTAADTIESSHALHASLAIVLDACLRNCTDTRLNLMIEHLQTFNGEGRDVSHDDMMDLSYRTGNLISFGLGNDDRSAPLALAASLIPSIFPHVHILTFWASLVPGLCHVLQSSSSNNNTNMNSDVQNLIQELLLRNDRFKIPTLTIADENKKGFSIPDMALSHIQSNTTVWKSLDMPNQVLTGILQHSRAVN